MRSANIRFHSIRMALFTAALSVVSGGIYADNGFEKWLPTDPLVKEWWQLYLSVPNPVREQLAESRKACGLGQHGNVWLLATAGTPDRTTTRRCTVPHGALLFVPVVTAVCSPFPGETLEDNVQLCRELIDPFDKLSLTIDGKNRSHLIERRAQSRGFGAWNPEDNIWDTPEADIPAGIYVSVAEGQYALIAGLRPGKHTIRARASSTSDSTLPKFDAIFEVTVQTAKTIVPK
jgi:hypothetical protein